MQLFAETVGLLALASLVLSGAESPYAGAASCAPCHPSESRRQTGTHHAAALRRAEATPLARSFPGQPIRERNGTSFDYDLTTAGLRVLAQQDSGTAAGILDWVFGAGALAMTPVGRGAQGYFEHRVSWYTASGGPGMTLGHSPARPANAEAALGRHPDANEITRCFNCHAAGVRPGPNLDWMEPGVGCERCHGPGRLHTQTRSKNDITLPGKGIEFCAQCHRSPTDQTGSAPERADPMLIRFAPVGLAASRCFRGSGNLTCVTCHNPHENARTEAAFYSGKCVGCHETKKQSSHCAFTRDDCLSCHMRKSTPVKDLTFTDHRIRVY